jgi:hypothetical protein
MHSIDTENHGKKHRVSGDWVNLTGTRGNGRNTMKNL